MPGATSMARPFAGRGESPRNTCWWESTSIAWDSAQPTMSAGMGHPPPVSGPTSPYRKAELEGVEILSILSTLRQSGSVLRPVAVPATDHPGRIQYQSPHGATQSGLFEHGQ